MKRDAGLDLAMLGSAVTLFGLLSVPWLRFDNGQVQRDLTFHDVAARVPWGQHTGLVATIENYVLAALPEWAYWLIAILVVASTIAAAATHERDDAVLGAVGCFVAAAWCLNWIWYVSPSVQNVKGQVGLGAWTSMVGFVLVGVAGTCVKRERTPSWRVNPTAYGAPRD